MDYSDYVDSDLIPSKTVATLQLKIKYGDATDGVLSRSKSGESEGLNVELTLLDGPHAKRKLFAWLLLVGATDGQKQMAEGNKGLLLSIINSALFLDPRDKSPEARAKRTFEYRDFDGIRFVAEIGIEQGKEGFADRNVISRVVTKDKTESAGRPAIEQQAAAGPSGVAPAAQPGSQAPPPVTKPSWAQ